MRVLYFSRDYTTHDHRFLSALAKTEHQVAYLRLEQRGHRLEDRALPPQIELVSWAGGNGPAALRDGPRLLAGLRKVLRQVKPDLVHAGPIQRCGFLTALAGFRPLVSASWGYDLIFDAKRSTAWAWATRFTLKRSAAMIGDCDTIRKLAVAYGMDDRRIVTFPWGIDLGHFIPSAHPHPYRAEVGTGHPFTILSTRSWEPIYGVDVIARAFVQAAQQNPHLRLVMLGNGSQAGLLHKIFAQGKVEERVYFPGQVSYHNLPGIYRAADLYVSASHSDGTSISLLEAMACGLPVLVSDIPGNREWAPGDEGDAPDRNGWLFPDGDAAALCQGILRAASDPERLYQAGRAARAKAEQRADWKQNFQQLLAAYELARKG